MLNDLSKLAEKYFGGIKEPLDLLISREKAVYLAKSFLFNEEIS
jgi:hypothetical protein